MGTQQILLIVLSVIIVGAAIAVGITMFNNQSYNSNKTAVAAEAQNYASQVVQYYKTPESQGGADRDPGKMTDALIGGYIGWGGPSTTTENGTFTVGAWAAADSTVTITGTGKEVKGGKVPQVLTKIKFPSGAISATTSDVDAP